MYFTSHLRIIFIFRGMPTNGISSSPLSMDQFKSQNAKITAKFGFIELSFLYLRLSWFEAAQFVLRSALIVAYTQWNFIMSLASLPQGSFFQVARRSFFKTRLQLVVKVS